KFTFLREQAGQAQQVLLLGTGEAAPDAAAVRALAFDAVRAGQAAGVEQLVLDVRGLGFAGESVRLGELIAQGLGLGTYRYDRFVSESKRKPATVQRVRVVGDPVGGEGTARGQVVAACVKRARDLVNGPANLVTPTHLAEFAREIAAALPERVSLKVLERDD